jgi:opacity protein-like surface antigen
MKKILIAASVAIALSSQPVAADMLDDVTPMINKGMMNWFMGQWCGYDQLAEDAGLAFVSSLRARYIAVNGPASAAEVDAVINLALNRLITADNAFRELDASMYDISAAECERFLEDAPKLKALAFELQKHL